MKKYVIAAAILAMLSVGVQNVYAADNAVSETTGFKAAGFMESEVENNVEDSAAENTSDRSYIKHISDNQPGEWNQYLSQRRAEAIKETEQKHRDTVRSIELMKANGEIVKMKKESKYSDNLDKYGVKSELKNDKLRMDNQYKKDMADLKQEYKKEKNAIDQEYKLYQIKLKTDMQLSKNELKNERKLADMERKMELEQQKWTHEQSVNNLKVEQQLKHRYFLLGKDKAFTYYMDLMNTRWVRMPYRSDKYMIDTWIRLVENSELEKSGGEPDKYYLEHYYMNDEKREIQFLCEMEVSDGYPDNTVNQRKYKPNQWEGLVPGSIEDELYHRVVNSVKATNRIPGKDGKKKDFWDIFTLSDDDMDKALKSVEDAAFIWNLKKLVEIIRI